MIFNSQPLLQVVSSDLSHVEYKTLWHILSCLNVSLILWRIFQLKRIDSSSCSTRSELFECTLFLQAAVKASRRGAEQHLLWCTTHWSRGSLVVRPGPPPGEWVKDTSQGGGRSFQIIVNGSPKHVRLIRAIGTQGTQRTLWWCSRNGVLPLPLQYMSSQTAVLLPHSVLLVRIWYGWQADPSI